MGNSIYQISEDEKCKIIQEAKTNDYLIVELNGNMIQTYFEYAYVMNREFDLQMHNVSNKDEYLDWMRDLSWIEKEGFVLIIDNFSGFLKDELEERNSIVKDFSNLILPFWEADGAQCIQGGRTKSFNVFLVM